MRIRLIISLIFSFVLLFSSAPILFAQNVTGIDLVLDPSTIKGKPGNTVDVKIMAVPHNQAFVALDLFLNFDPSFLEVIDSVSEQQGIQINPGTVLTQQLLNNVENQLGEISYGAGMLMGQEYSSTEPVLIATVTFKINAEASGQTAVTFNTNAPRSTQVAYKGTSVWNSLVGAGIAVDSTPAVVQPIVKPPPPPPPSPSPPTIEPQPAPSTTPAPGTAPSPSTSPAPSQTPAPLPTPSKTPAPSTSPAPNPATQPSAPVQNQEPASKPILGLTWWMWTIIGIVVVVVVARLVIWRVNRAK